jgi:hypothetical protein
MRLQSTIALGYLALSLMGCPTSSPSTQEMKTRPADFSIHYKSTNGSLPPPYHYEYTIRIEPAGAGQVELIPGYPFLDPSVVLPTWVEHFHVVEQNLDDVYRVMVENELFTRSWRKSDTRQEPGGGLESLVVLAGGKQITVKDFLASEQEASARVMYAAVRDLVPKNLWEQLEARREQYIEEYQRRRRGHHDEHEGARGC